MFYDTARNDHGLPHNPFKACIVPRPIAWVTSCDAQGRVNAAPFSYFNAVADHPPMIMFSACSKDADGTHKDTVRNILETQQFVINMVTFAQHQQMGQTSAVLPYGESEIAHAGLEIEPSQLIAPPRIKGSPIQMECRLWRTVDLPASKSPFTNTMVIGNVIGIHIEDAILVNGQIDATKLDIVARMGYHEYARIDHLFSKNRPQ